MRRHLTLLLCLACSYGGRSQTAPPQADTDQSREAAEIQPSVVKTIKKWLDSEEDDDLRRLLALGDVKTRELAAACGSSEDDVGTAAFLALQLLGKSECEPCAASVSQSRGGVALACSADIGEKDYERIESWVAKKRTSTGYECGEEYDPFAPMDDSVVYALILDGSSRSQAILENMLQAEKVCATGSTILAGTLEQAQPLIGDARKLGHNIKVVGEGWEDSVRHSAFFLPEQYRQDSKVEVVCRNLARDRILLEVSYRCGNLCGSGYYVVLRRDGADWHYALVRMAWIS